MKATPLIRKTPLRAKAAPRQTAIKPKARPRKSKAEREHLAAVAGLACVICWAVPVEVHHIRAGQGMGQRASDFDTIPLCPAHHRTGGMGIAFHAGPREFQANFGSEAALLEKTKERLARNAK